MNKHKLDNGKKEPTTVTGGRKSLPNVPQDTRQTKS